MSLVRAGAVMDARRFSARREPEQGAGKCILEEHLRVAHARITREFELLMNLSVNFNGNYRAGFGPDGNLGHILKDREERSNLRPELPIYNGFLPYSDH